MYSGCPQGSNFILSRVRHTHTHVSKKKSESLEKTLFKKIYFIYLFLAVLGLCCCARVFFSCGEWGATLCCDERAQ